MRKLSLVVLHWFLQRFHFLRSLVLNILLWYTNTRLEPLNKQTIAGLEEEKFGEFRRSIPKQVHTDIRKAPPKKLPSEGWMLMREDILIGYISYVDYITHWYVDSFAVEKVFEGQGYGTILGLKMLEESNNRMLIAMVRKGHIRTENMYLRAGFEIVQRDANIMGSTKMIRY